eukprot:2213440-Rhodomonas_salina.2
MHTTTAASDAAAALGSGCSPSFMGVSGLHARRQLRASRSKRKGRRRSSPVVDFHSLDGH